MIRPWIMAILFAVFAIWSVAASWHHDLVLGVLAGAVYVELGLAIVRAASFAGGVVFTEDLARRVAPPLVELCAKANCALPRVVLRDDAVRAAVVVKARGYVRIVFSNAFVERVDDRQLRTIVAHEVAHIVRRDLRWAYARVQASLVLVVSAVAVTAATATRSLPYPVWLGGILVLSIAIRTALALTNRPLELRADIEGARLADDPAGLAAALNTTKQFVEEARTRIYGPPPWRWLLGPLSWRSPTHPPMAKRIERLQAMARPEPA